MSYPTLPGILRRYYWRWAGVIIATLHLSLTMSTGVYPIRTGSDALLHSLPYIRKLLLIMDEFMTLLDEKLKPCGS